MTVYGMKIDYLTRARARWRRATWIDGHGRWASISECSRGPTVVLHETRAQAEAAKSVIDSTGCGGGCTGRHSVIDMKSR
jgi:hypothetical protein